MSNSVTLNANQTAALIRCYDQRRWSLNPDGPQDSHPCELRSVKITAGMARNLAAKGLLVVTEFGACITRIKITMTPAGVALARTAKGPACQARAAALAGVAA